MNQLIEDIQKDIENLMEKRSKLLDENSNTEAEINDILEENKLLEGEIDKLGQRTSQKMGEM